MSKAKNQYQLVALQQKSKAYNEIASNSKQAIQAIIQIDGLQKKLYNCIEQKEEKESDKKDAAALKKEKKKHMVNR